MSYYNEFLGNLMTTLAKPSDLPSEFIDFILRLELAPACLVNEFWPNRNHEEQIIVVKQILNIYRLIAQKLEQSPRRGECIDVMSKLNTDKAMAMETHLKQLMFGNAV